MFARTTILITTLALGAFAQDRYILRVPAAQVSTVANKYNLTILSQVGPDRDLFRVEVPNSGMLNQLHVDPTVQSVEPDVTATLPHKPVTAPSSTWGTDQWAGNWSDPNAWKGYTQQPAGNIIRIADAHRFATGRGVVAILDTGIDATHPVLANSVDAGWDFTTNTAGGAEASVNQSTTSILDDDKTIVFSQSTTSILDFALGQSTTSILDGGTTIHSAYGHGTMIAGLVHLVAPSARLMPVKVFGNDGTASLADILNGVYWAVDHGADVISMSFSMPGFSKELQKAFDYANSKHVICVAAVGNEGETVTLFPAGYNKVIGVGSTTDAGGRALFSNYGDAVFVAAPGNQIISTYPGNGYAAGWGTSFSAPLVSGAAALLLQVDSSLNESGAEKAIEQANPLPKDLGLGAGVLDLYRAVSYAAGHGGK